MQRILIVGCSGAGKSTLALALGQQLGLEVIHLDREYWRPGWAPTPRAEFIERLAGLLARERWIMDGNFDSTLELRLTRADTLIFLDFPRGRCLAAVLGRTLALYGRTRPDMTPGCPERLDWAFVRWIWSYPSEARPSILTLLGQARAAGRETVVLRSRAEIKAWLVSIGSVASPV